jgi:hypothetical protein
MGRLVEWGQRGLQLAVELQTTIGVDPGQVNAADVQVPLQRQGQGMALGMASVHPVG